MVRERRSKYPKSTFISHPRSGLTWMRWMMHETRKRQDPQNFKNTPLDTEEWNPLIAYDHDCMGLTSWSGRRNKHPRSRGINKWEEFKVVFLIRDPRDTLLSNYYRLVVRGKQVEDQAERVQNYNLESFIKCEFLGLIPYVEWILWWEKNKHDCVDFMPVFFEETLANPATALSCVLQMATDENVPMQTILDVVEASTIEVMREHENKHGTIYKDQTGAVNDDPDTALIRKGTTGQWKEEFTEELAVWCNDAMAPLRHTFAERYTWRCNQ